VTIQTLHGAVAGDALESATDWDGVTAGLTTAEPLPEAPPPSFELSF
jgi:hypothetical protein